MRLAVLNTVGDAELSVTRTEGHHANPIDIVVATVHEEDKIIGFFRKLEREDLEELRRTMAMRLDEACNMFIKLDKQSAFAGAVRLGTGDDVISVRVKIRAFPAKPGLALKIATEFLSGMLDADM